MSHPLPPAPRKGLRYWTILLAVAFAWFTLFSTSISRLWASGLDLGWLFVVGMLFYVGTAVLEGVRSTRAPRFPLFMTNPEDLGFAYQDITFPSTDGLHLSGWYVPSQNGAHIVLTHGFGENRLGMVPIARILVEAGYGVLLYDSRAHGRSQGNLSSWGWLETADLSGALDYLASRDDVDMARVGGMGFSVGGQITLRTAAHDPRLAAVAADGPTTAVLADHRFGRRFLFRTTRLYPWLWIVYNMQSLLVGRAQPAGVVAALPHISPRPLWLISTGKSGERFNVQHFMEAAQEPKTLWEMPDTSHGRGLSQHPDEYKKHLLKFFAVL